MKTKITAFARIRTLVITLNAAVAFLGLTALASPAMAVSENKQVENEIRQLLKDPDSAKFGSLFKCSLTDNAWMGTLNAKNSYGGYTGMDEFYYKRGEGLIFFSTADEMERAVFGVKRSVCLAKMEKGGASPSAKVSQAAPRVAKHPHP